MLIKYGYKTNQQGQPVLTIMIQVLGVIVPIHKLGNETITPRDGKRI